MNPFSPRRRARYRSDRHRYTSVKTLTKLKLSPSAGVSMRCRLETTEQQVNRVLTASSRPVSVLLDANASLVATLNSISRFRCGAAGKPAEPWRGRPASCCQAGSIPSFKQIVRFNMTSLRLHKSRMLPLVLAQASLGGAALMALDF